MNITECIAVLATILSVLMLSLGKSSGWLLSIIGCALYGVIFIEQKLYANFIIQIIFIFQSIYGLYEWKNKDLDNVSFSSKKMDKKSLIKILLVTLEFSLIISCAMYYYTNNKSPFLDTTLSLWSMVATIMIAEKIIQSWFLWMVIDIGYVILFCSIGLWVSAGLYLLLLIICISGYINWNKKEITFKNYEL